MDYETGLVSLRFLSSVYIFDVFSILCEKVFKGVVFVQPNDLAGVDADAMVAKVSCSEVDEIIEHLAMRIVEKTLFLALVNDEAQFALRVSGSRVVCGDAEDAEKSSWKECEYPYHRFGGGHDCQYDVCDSQGPRFRGNSAEGFGCQFANDVDHYSGYSGGDDGGENGVLSVSYRVDDQAC